MAWPSASQAVGVRGCDDREIDVRSVDERDAPPGHGAIRVRLEGAPEFLLRSIMGEGVGEGQSAIVGLLGFD